VSRVRTIHALAALAILSAACGSGEPPKAPTGPAPSATASAAPVASAPPGNDPLGPRPTPTVPAPFKPPAPVVYTTPSGVTVWLLERHALPMVAVTVTVPTGASSDPKGQAGLALATANMLDEGGGKLGALDFARAIDQLGAKLRTGASADLSFAQLTVLKRNLGPAMALLGDAIVRPRFDAVEWKRVHDLWVNDLRQRASDPEDVSSVVSTVALFGADHPYGHTSDGFVATAAKVQLADAKKFYATAWRPDRAIVVAVGDVTKAELDPQLEAAFGAWKKPADAPLPIVAPPAPEGAARPKVVLVDRPDAPQSVIAVVRPGVAASDPNAPPLARVNNALGGSFTSRLNQDLREEHGWTYGARSRVAANRGVGSTSASAAVVTEKTAEALKAMLADLDDYARIGLTDDEVTKTRLQARAELVEQFESVEATSFRLARNAAFGLPPDYEAKASILRDEADKRTLSKLASIYFDRAQAVIVIVGPRVKLEAPLAQIGITGVELRDAEGNVVNAAAKDAKDSSRR
jgi:predicted Zn-dependent peptidase